MSRIVALIFVITLLCGCRGGKTEPQADSDSTSVDLMERHDSLSRPGDAVAHGNPNKDSVLMSLTKEILTVFKTRQYSRLDSFIHPTEGVRFSPYATVEPSDKKFSKDDFNSLLRSAKTKKINWGSYDGSGDPILLTPNEYFGKFVYDANFVKPEKAAVNNFIGGGNSINNLKNFYRDADFTESHISGGKTGMDWKSVRLVFKQIDGKFYLVGVVHDQWTI